MQRYPELPKGVSPDDVISYPKEGTENDPEPVLIFENKKTGERYGEVE